MKGWHLRFGRKIRDYLAKRKMDVVKSWAGIKKVDQELVDAVAERS
jgi:hypothetical protein